MYQIIFIYIMLTNDPNYEYVLFLDVIVHIYAEKPNKFKFKLRAVINSGILVSCF